MSNSSLALELWGGVECTYNRVHDNYMDQTVLSGHDTRAGDLEKFAELGIKAIRYPVLWERVAPRSIKDADWSWTDARLSRLRELGIRPVVGLVHHGSGPITTSLADEAFPQKVADFAGAVAERYPWIDAYTPINEPLTTARFSGLYGHWYPHCRSTYTFAKTLLHQCKAVVLAMRAIRSVNPAASLVQTEDLGETHSTPALRGQAEFENERRWVSSDLLSGQLTPHKLMWKHFASAGIQPAELHWFQENACPPDISGWNYYLTSERFLDEELANYPTSTHGGNARVQYADVEAVRVRGITLAGRKKLLREAWERYKIPVALTEVQLSCHREEQMRWLLDAWSEAQQLSSEGVDFRAVTAWSLLGAYNWNSLVCTDCGFYESGAYDVSSGQPRDTALVPMIRDISKGTTVDHPALPRSGWWERESRFRFPPVRHIDAIDSRKSSNEPTAAPILITGCRGTLGTAIQKICRGRDLNYVALCRDDLDITSPLSVANAIERFKPWAVINAAAYVRVDDAEADAKRCYRTNSTGAAVLAKASHLAGAQFLTFSTDMVFDGEQDLPYVESSEPNPINVYGMSKLAAEQLVLAANPQALVVRTSAFFGPWDRHNFVTYALERFSQSQPLRAATDWFVSPTYVPDLVNRCLDLLIDAESGVWHLSNSGVESWATLATRAATLSGLADAKIHACTVADLNLPAPRPRYTALGSSRGGLLPSLDDALQRYFVDVRPTPGASSQANRWQSEEKEVFYVVSSASGPASSSDVRT